MKCNNCHDKDAVFVQQTFTNDHREEIALCAGCARELGYIAPSDGAISGIDALFSQYAARLTPFFAPKPSGVRSASARRAETPHVAATVAPEVIAPPIDAELAHLREMNVLRERMRAAAASENFELAMRLRDEIKQMEAPREG